ncbi:response regulator [Amycolatopsis sp. NPDC049252]|uniref:response regulator transcription factor n=1 Tax=Amycolatopsis sp. NPDC049252 TaxID=3363933 RepID=UPI00371F22D9
MVESCAADPALVDLAMPPLGGAAAIRQIKRRHPATRVLAPAGSDDLEFAERALRAGADGLETRDIGGRMLVSERTAKRVVASLLNRIGAANRVEAAGLAGAYGLLDHDPADRPQ